MVLKFVFLTTEKERKKKTAQLSAYFSLSSGLFCCLVATPLIIRDYRSTNFNASTEKKIRLLELLKKKTQLK